MEVFSQLGFPLSLAWVKLTKKLTSTRTEEVSACVRPCGTKIQWESVSGGVKSKIQRTGIGHMQESWTDAPNPQGKKTSWTSY